MCIVLFILVVIGHVGCQHLSIPAIECYNSTTCPCCSESVQCPSDGSGMCYDNCKDGYHGKKCFNRCPVNCIKCVDAQNGGGVSNCTVCLAGFYFTEDLYQCQSACSSICQTCMRNASNCSSCHKGYYLKGSHECHKCIEPCESCSSETNCTSCKAGFYFDQQEKHCKKCNPLCSRCNSSETCLCSNGCNSQEDYDGICYGNGCKFGCRTNFTSLWPNTYTCDKCNDGNYGIECDQQCHEHCNFNRCERVSGHCFGCKAGFYGNTCELACPRICKTSCAKPLSLCDPSLPDYYGLECKLHCRKSCLECMKTNGSCITCVDGFYGKECENDCSVNCEDRKCAKSGGTCECVSGYTGPTCEVGTTFTTRTYTITSSDGPSRSPSSVEPASYDPQLGLSSNNVEATVGISLAAVVFIFGIVSAILWWYKRRQNGLNFTIKALANINGNKNDTEKVEKDLREIDSQLSKLGTLVNTLTSRRSEIEAKLEGLKGNIPYIHTGQADSVEDKSYEMLQRRNNESHYSSLE